MPCDSCKSETRCSELGLCQTFRQQIEPKECRPGGHCERYARGLGACVAGFCNRPKDADGVAVGAPGATDAERAAWLADKIVALGDYAKEAAAMLRRWPDGVAVPQTSKEQR